MQIFIALTCSFGCSLVEASILAKTRLSKPLKCLANFSTCLLVVSQPMHHGVCTCFPTVNIRSFEETIELFFFFFLLGKNKLKKLVHKIDGRHKSINPLEEYSLDCSKPNHQMSFLQSFWMLASFCNSRNRKHI